MFQQYDLVRIINLPRRTDRKREIIAELEKQGVTVDGERVAFFDAVAPDSDDGFYSVGANGCYRSHLAILKEAGERSVLIIEDDCDFAPNAKNVQVPDCAVFHAGYLAERLGTHLIGYQPGAAKIVADYLQQLLDDGRRISFDGALFHFREDNPTVKAIFADPVIGFQRPSKTDVGQTGLKDKIPFIGVARAVKRNLTRAIRQFA